MTMHLHTRLDTLQRTAARLEKDTRTGRTPKGRIFDTAIAVTMLRILARLEVGASGPVDARIQIPGVRRNAPAGSRSPASSTPSQCTVRSRPSSGTSPARSTGTSRPDTPRTPPDASRGQSARA